jgi:hypothetical protein
LQGSDAATVTLTINDVGLTSGSETFQLIVQQNSSDPVSVSLASTNFTILNNDSTSFAPPSIVADGSIDESVNTNFLLQPFFSFSSTGKTISLINFINTKTGAGELSFDGDTTPGNLGVAYADVDEVGFATGSLTGSDEIEIYATYSDGTTSNVVDLIVDVQAASSPPPPETSRGPVVNTSVQPLRVTTGALGVITAGNLSASDAAYSDPSDLIPLLHQSELTI